MLDQRGQLLRAALGFAGLPRPSGGRTLHALRSLIDSWSVIGRIAVGMHRQCYDFQLTQYDERGWRATFYTTGMEHSPTSATGTAWERRPLAGDAKSGVGLLHDLRRSAVRNLERAGTSRSVAMKLTGHKTEAAYRRYAIVAESDLREAGTKLAATLGTSPATGFAQ